MTAPRSFSFTPAASALRPSVLGLRPVANRTASASSSDSLSDWASVTVIIASCPVCLMDCTLVFILNSMPFFSRASFTLAAISLSSRGINSG